MKIQLGLGMKVRTDSSGDLSYWYRHISKGGWPFSTPDNSWIVSDCTSEGLKVTSFSLSSSMKSNVVELHANWILCFSVINYHTLLMKKMIHVAVKFKGFDPLKPFIGSALASKNAIWHRGRSNCSWPFIRRCQRDFVPTGVTLWIIPEILHSQLNPTYLQYSFGNLRISVIQAVHDLPFLCEKQ